MANSLNRDLNNCEVVLRRDAYPEGNSTWDEEKNRTVFVTGGFGANPKTNRNALFVRGRDGVSFRAEGYQVERLVREVPEDEREIIYIVTVMWVNGVETHEVSALNTIKAISKTLELKGWGSFPQKMGVDHDDAMMEVDGVDYIIKPRMKGVTQ